MKKPSKTVQRFFCRTVYLLPLISAFLMILYAAIPHLWFVYEYEAYDTLSLFSLQSNVWAECDALLNGEAAASSFAVYFSHIMRVVCVLFWFSMILYGLLALLCAICSTVAFAHSPTHRYSNRSKRVLHLLCPGRILYLVLNLAPLVWGFFAQILLFAYRNFMGYRPTLHYFWLPDWVLSLFFTLLCTGTFLFTLSMQADARLDMFRIYKARKVEAPLDEGKEVREE